jgi:hypothetical protein
MFLKAYDNKRFAMILELISESPIQSEKDINFMIHTLVK